MKITTLLFLVAVTNVAFRQTENHKVIAGTKYSITSPKGFVAATVWRDVFKIPHLQQYSNVVRNPLL